MNENLIYQEYSEGISYKSAIGNRGLFEQNRINERFFIGDQWYGAKCGNERPLVRHNVIKRIGERIDLTSLSERALKNAYITGTAVLYTYWDSQIPTGLFADKDKQLPIKGDICCEVLNIEDVVFGDPYCEMVQNQPYIIIASRKNEDEVLREARLHGADMTALSLISEEAVDGKITVLTKLWKRYKRDGSYTVAGTKVTQKAVIRQEFSVGNPKTTAPTGKAKLPTLSPIK